MDSTQNSPQDQSKSSEQKQHDSKQFIPPWIVGGGSLVALLVFLFGDSVIPGTRQFFCDQDQLPILLYGTKTISTGTLQIEHKGISPTHIEPDKPVEVPYEHQPIRLVITEAAAYDSPSAPNQNRKWSQRLIYQWQYIYNQQKVNLPGPSQSELILPTQPQISYPVAYWITAEVSCERCETSQLKTYQIVIQPPAPTKSQVDEIPKISTSNPAVQFTKNFLQALAPYGTPVSIRDVYDNLLSPDYKNGITRYAYRNGEYQPTPIAKSDYIKHYLRGGLTYESNSIKLSKATSFDDTIVSVMMQDTNPEANEPFRVQKYIHLVQTSDSFQVKCITNNPNHCKPVRGGI